MGFLSLILQQKPSEERVTLGCSRRQLFATNASSASILTLRAVSQLNPCLTLKWTIVKLKVTLPVRKAIVKGKWSESFFTCAFESLLEAYHELFTMYFTSTNAGFLLISKWSTDTGSFLGSAEYQRSWHFHGFIVVKRQMPMRFDLWFLACSNIIPDYTEVWHWQMTVLQNWTMNMTQML